jgi:poly(3-hydroxybutyrate) depolymerase
MPAMVMHGLTDSTVPIEQGLNARDFWLEANGCPDATSIPLDSVLCRAYSGCEDAVLWCPHAGDHEWPEHAGPDIRMFFLSQLD